MPHKDDPASAPPKPATLLSLQKKRRICGGYRVHSSKLISEAKGILKDKEVTILKLDHLSVSLKDKVAILRTIDDETFNFMDDDDVETEVLQCEGLKSEIQAIIIELDLKKEELKRRNRNERLSAAPFQHRALPPLESATKLP